MSEHKATIHWTRTSPDFLRGRYSREHTWSFDEARDETGDIVKRLKDASGWPEFLSVAVPP